MKRALLLLAALAACGHDTKAPPSSNHAPKVMIIDMFSLEGDAMVGTFGLDQDIATNGLTVHCNANDICEIVTGMGYANAAASTAALLYSPGFDFSSTYFVIAGIAGVDPAMGTLGTAAWARYAVDFGNANELDAREMPTAWPYGYFAVGSGASPDPTAMPAPVIPLDPTMEQAAFQLSKDVVLGDDPTAQATRAHYPSAPANQPPVVTQCDVVSSDTWFAGAVLGRRARDLTTASTGGQGTFCMSAQEDNATLEVLAASVNLVLVDTSRIALVRTASDFSAPYPGQTDSDALLMSLNAGGLSPALDNLPKVVAPLVKAIENDWDHWQLGVPPPGA